MLGVLAWGPQFTPFINPQGCCFSLEPPPGRGETQVGLGHMEVQLRGIEGRFGLEAWHGMS